MSNLRVKNLLGVSYDNYEISIPSGHNLRIDGNLQIPFWTTTTRPTEVEIGMVGYNTSTQAFEIYIGGSNPWGVISLSNNPADTGAGAGWSINQGADGTNVTGFTTTSMTQYVDSWYLSAGGSGGGGILNYACSGSSASFHWHTGHNGNSTQWPLYYAINVSSQQKGKVLNQIQWYTHSNAIGNVDFFGSNKEITSSNYRTESNYTYLGRAHFGGYGGGSSDCTVYSRTFNASNYGYKWYMLKLVDNNSSALSYPSSGNLGGWAMYGMRLNKI